MKRVVCAMLIVSITVVGCSGSNPNPISVYQPGDKDKSCDELKAEIKGIGKQISRREKTKTQKEIGNVLWFLGGCVLLFPFMGMDLKNAEAVEIEALQNRKNKLNVIAAGKGCDF